MQCTTTTNRTDVGIATRPSVVAATRTCTKRRFTLSRSIIMSCTTSSQLASYTHAKSLYSAGRFSKLRVFLRSNYFSAAHQPDLQNLWYCSLYEEYKVARGLLEMTPAQRYRIRRNNPLPKTLSATKFTANNYFDDDTKAILDFYFAKSKYPLPEDCETMMARTGLKMNQIKTYFKNKRSRTKAPETELNVTEEGGIDIVTGDDSVMGQSELGEMSFGTFDADSIDFEMNLSRITQMIKSEPSE
ncbi:hypothetical protein ACHWQZ_G001471 [Mnemiopsis leidyi]